MYLPCLFGNYRLHRPDVEGSNDDHGSVEDPVPAEHVLLIGHLVLDGQDDADPLEGEDGRPKEDWEVRRARLDKNNRS